MPKRVVQKKSGYIPGKSRDGSPQTPASISIGERLLLLHTRMSAAKTGEAMARAYLKNERTFQAIVSESNRVLFLIKIAKKNGIKFEKGEKPTEQELLQKLFGRPKPKQVFQDNLL